MTLILLLTAHGSVDTRGGGLRGVALQLALLLLVRIIFCLCTE